MMVKVLYFAGLREALATSGEEIRLPAGVASVAALRDHVAAREPRQEVGGDDRAVGQRLVHVPADGVEDPREILRREPRLPVHRAE